MSFVFHIQHKLGINLRTCKPALTKWTAWIITEELTEAVRDVFSDYSSDATLKVNTEPGDVLF